MLRKLPLELKLLAFFFYMRAPPPPPSAIEFDKILFKGWTSDNLTKKNKYHITVQDIADITDQWNKKIRRLKLNILQE